MFAGTVLPPTGQNLIAADAERSFHVRDDEKAELCRSLVGKPVRFEHEPDLTAGEIKSAYVRGDGSIAVVGSMNKATLTADYLRNCMVSNNGKYHGLSLCHEWECCAANATDRKRPLEVSLCTQPKRPGCHVEFFVDDYKRRAPAAVQKHMASTTDNPPTQQPAGSAAPAPPAPAPADPAPAPPAPAAPDRSAEVEAMEVALRMKERAEKAQQTADALQLKLDAIDAERKAAEDAENEKLKQQSDALSKALKDNWAQWAPDTTSYESAEQLFKSVQDSDPKLGHELLTLVQCASSRTLSAQADLATAKANAAHQQLKQQYTSQVASLLDQSDVHPAAPTPAVAAAAAAAPTPAVAAAAATAAPAVAAPTPNPYLFETAAANRNARPEQPYKEYAENIRTAFKSMAGGSGNMLNTMQRVVEAASEKSRHKRLRTF
jgi:hypothetical protein